MNTEEIRKKAIECGAAFQKMCDSVVFDDDTVSCPCEFDYLGDSAACSAVYCYEHGFADGVEEGRNEVITELLETSKKDLVDIAWDILNRGIERGKELVLDDVKKLLYKTKTDKVAEIVCDDGEIRTRPLIDVARVYEILEKVKGENV